MEEARALDLQDRFLNTKAAKYLFRDGQVEEANSVLGLFTKVVDFFVDLTVALMLDYRKMLQVQAQT